jgi:hypothetical protein
MATIEATASAAPSRGGAISWWPLVAAPFAGLLYYLALLTAFRTAIGDVVADTADLADFKGLTWGTHWIYHTFAEAVSLAFGTFVAGGIARERAQVAGLIGGFGISLWWTAWLAIVAFLMSSNGVEFTGNPWYEWVIFSIAAIAAPIVGYVFGETGKEISTGYGGGFAGIPRLHFLWLWVPAHFYGVAIIGPIMTYLLAYFLGYDGSRIMVLDSSVLTGILYFVLYVIPVVAFFIPLFMGLGLMSGSIGNANYGTKPMHSALRQTLGTVVLIVGWWIAAAIHYGVIRVINWL